MAVALGVQVEVQVVASQLAREQLHTTDFDDAVATLGGQAGGFGVENNLAAHAATFNSMVLFGMVQRVLRNLDGHVLLRQDGLAAQA